MDINSQLQDRQTRLDGPRLPIFSSVCSYCTYYQLSRQCKAFFWQAYKTVIPHERHRAVGKETGQTNHIERLNNTFRQRVSRLVRESLSFSKKLNNHIGAIWYFIHGYNAEMVRT